MTQRDRVLHALRAAGTRGITQADFLRDPPDGGPPITRLAARIEELRAVGYFIAGGRWRDKCRVYTLIASPEGLEPIKTPTVETPERLFTPPAAGPRNALDDDWAA